jgi:hypothetical protein
MRIMTKENKWLRCPIKRSYIYIEDCDDCIYQINRFKNEDGVIVVVCPFKEERR